MWTVTLYFPYSHHSNLLRMHCCLALSINPTEDTHRAKEAFCPNLTWRTNQLTGVAYHSTLKQEVAYKGFSDDTKPVLLVSPAQFGRQLHHRQSPWYQQRITTQVTSEFLASFLGLLSPPLPATRACFNLQETATQWSSNDSLAKRRQVVGKAEEVWFSLPRLGLSCSTDRLVLTFFVSSIWR